MHYTARVRARVESRWWWFASVLVHATVMGVVTVTPARDPEHERAARSTTEIEFDRPSIPRPPGADRPREDRGSDAGAPRLPSAPTTLGGVRSAQNIDSSERGERGDGRSQQHGRLLATRAERVHFGVELRNADGVDQVPRIRTGSLRESPQNDRRTPQPGDEAYLSLAAGELWFRVPRGSTRAPATGALAPEGAATRAGGVASTPRPLGDTERLVLAEREGARARDGAGVRGASGARASTTGLAREAHANIERGHASTTAERLAPRPRDDEDAAALATSLARDALNTTVHDGPRRGEGVGGVGGGGRAGSGGGAGEGGRARAFGEGDGVLSLSSPDPRYRPYFLALRRALVRLLEGAFPEEAALALEEGRVIVELRVERSGALSVLRFARRSGIAAFDANVQRALDGARGPSIPESVSTEALRVRFDYLVENPVVR